MENFYNCKMASRKDRQFALLSKNFSKWADCGFYSVDEKKYHFRCFACGNGFMFGMLDPWYEHGRKYPNCPNSVGPRSKMVVEKYNLIVRESPFPIYSPRKIQYPNMSDPRDRLKTFMNNNPDSEILVNAGFFYQNDCIVCYVCGIELKDWNLENLETLHQKSAWYCPVPDIYKTPDTEEEEYCDLCWWRLKTIVYLPCGHLIACKKCAMKETYCTTCDKKIDYFYNSKKEMFCAMCQNQIVDLLDDHVKIVCPKKKPESELIH